MQQCGKIISKFQNKKSPGPDNITPKLLKAIKDEISDPLLYLFNLSFSSGIFLNGGGKYMSFSKILSKILSREMGL